MRSYHLLPALLALLFLTPTLPAQTDPTLEHQNRGDYWEGLKATPVSGQDLTLLSARADTPLPETWTEEATLLFYLPEKTPAHLTVRQLRSKTTYYWLDQVKRPWQPERANAFTWPTSLVLRQTSVKPQDLGAVIRLDRAEPGKRERIAPAVLYRDAPAEIAGYRFTLRTNGAAQVRCRFLAADSDQVLSTRLQNREKAGSPFTVRFQPGNLPEGWYRLIVDGWLEGGDGAKLYKEIHFFHKKRLEHTE